MHPGLPKLTHKVKFITVATYSVPGVFDHVKEDPRIQDVMIAQQPVSPNHNDCLDQFAGGGIT